MIKMPRMSPPAEEAHTLFPSSRGAGGVWCFCCPPPPPCCRPSATPFSLAHCRDQSAGCVCIGAACMHSRPRAPAEGGGMVPACPSRPRRVPSVIPKVDLYLMHSPEAACIKHRGSMPTDEKHETFRSKCSAQTLASPVQVLSN